MKKKLFFLAITVLAIINYSPAQAETVDCFDYYKFQSVQVNVSPNLDFYYPGEKIKFTGTITNENKYPIVDGYLFVRIGKHNDNYVEEGYYTVDEFFALEKVVLEPNVGKEISFDWKVPLMTANGAYHADFFFSAGKKFNLGGLPFTNEVVASGVDFNVKSSNSFYVDFDKKNTKINGKAYNHIGKWPVFEKDSQVIVQQPIINSFSEKKTVNITYDLFYWDSLNEKDKINNRSETITVPAKGKVDLNYTIPKVEKAVYYLRITANYGERKSIVNIRFSNKNGEARLNYPAIDKFPLAKGDTANLFSCFHNTGESKSSGKVTVQVFDQAGKQVGMTEFSGEISGEMVAIAKAIKAEDNYDYLKLKAELRDDKGNVVDSYETEYNCQVINPSLCKKEEIGGISPFSKEGKITGKSALLIIFLLIPLIVIVVIRLRKRGNITTMFLLFLLVIFGLTMPGESPVEARITKTVGYSNVFSNVNYIAPQPNLTITKLSSSYYHRVALNSEDLLFSIGEVLNFEDATPRPFFNGIGYTWDSPYGAICDGEFTEACAENSEWITTPVYTTAALTFGCPSEQCDNLGLPCDDGDGSVCTLPALREFNYYVAVTAKRSPMRMFSDNTAVVQCADQCSGGLCSDMTCKAVGEGTANIVTWVGNLTGKIWMKGAGANSVRPGTEQYWEPDNWPGSTPGEVNIHTPGYNPNLGFKVRVGAPNTLTAPLTVEKDVTQMNDPAFTGRVTSNDHYIDCGPGCSLQNHDYPITSPVTVVTLTAVDYESANIQWEGPCVSGTGGTSASCNVEMDQQRDVKVIFSPIGETTHMLTIIVDPAQAGKISSSSHPSISCQANCSYNIPAGETVNLQQSTSTEGYSFTNWSDACSGSGLCSVQMLGARTVTAHFASSSLCRLNVSVTGQGRVTGGGIYCTSTGGTCSYDYSPSESVTLKASPNIGADFSGWGGVCSTSGTNFSCGVTMGTGENCGRNASAAFTTIPCTGYVCDPCGEDQCGYVTDLKCYDCNNNEVDQSYCPNRCYTNCGSCQSGRWREVVPE